MSIEQTPLLTAHLFVLGNSSNNEFKVLRDQLEESGITVKLYKPNEALTDINPKHPRVYVSIGSDWQEFQTLNALPLHERKRWLHFQLLEDVQPFKLFYCWFKFTEPIPHNKAVPASQFTSDTPLVSVFTASYKSKEKIQRPYRSLLNQTYSNWEWVIVDDSGDEDATYHNDLLPLTDTRVRRYRQDSQNGYIGATKRYAAGLCTGEILVEVDHDDDLTPDCLEKIVRAFQQNPECGFAFGDCSEVYVDNNYPHWYGWDCGFGTCIYYRVWVHEMNRWQNVYKNTTINAETIRHLVGLPNHPRAWTRDCYHLIGGHREELLVADDYDILIRTFLCTKYVAIPDLLYIQYRNQGGDNSTFHRNNQIQILVNELYRYYFPKIRERIQELNLPEEIKEYSRVWERTIDDSARISSHIIHEHPTKTSYLFPIPYSKNDKRNSQLFKILDRGLDSNFKEMEVVVVGNVPTDIEAYAAKAPMGAIRWWQMESNVSIDMCIEYAKLCASCKEKVVVLP